MAKDDYHVIVYQILAYLYTQLKAGDAVDPELLKAESPYLGINPQYWTYIMENLSKNGLIEGILLKPVWGEGLIVSGLESARITPKGIEYLTDNSFLSKAKEFQMDIKAIVPFI